MTDFPRSPHSWAHAEAGWAWRIFDEEGETGRPRPRSEANPTPRRRSRGAIRIAASVIVLWAQLVTATLTVQAVGRSSPGSAAQAAFSAQGRLSHEIPIAGRFTAAVATAGLRAGGGAGAPNPPPPKPRPLSTRPEADLAAFNQYVSRSSWVRATYITEDTQFLEAKATGEQNQLVTRYAMEAAKYDGVASIR